MTKIESHPNLNTKEIYDINDDNDINNDITNDNDNEINNSNKKVKYKDYLQLKNAYLSLKEKIAI